MKIFDLNVPLETSPSEPLPVGVEHQSHQASAQFMASFFGATVADLPHGYGWANDSVTMNAHSGTHVDAPWHYYPTCADQPARTIDQMPLEWFYGDGVVLDFRYKERGGLISAADVQDALDNIGYALKPHDIVLIQTGADKCWGQREYFDAGAGMTAEATRWLIEHDPSMKDVGLVRRREWRDRAQTKPWMRFVSVSANRPWPMGPQRGACAPSPTSSGGLPKKNCECQPRPDLASITT